MNKKKLCQCLFNDLKSYYTLTRLITLDFAVMQGVFIVALQLLPRTMQSGESRKSIQL